MPNKIDFTPESAGIDFSPSTGPMAGPVPQSVMSGANAEIARQKAAQPDDSFLGGLKKSLGIDAIGQSIAGNAAELQQKGIGGIPSIVGKGLLNTLGPAQAAGEQGVKVVRALRSGNPVEALGQGAAVAFPPAAMPGEEFKAGRYASGAGATAGTLAQFLLPEALRKVGPALKEGTTAVAARNTVLDSIKSAGAKLELADLLGKDPRVAQDLDVALPKIVKAVSGGPDPVTGVGGKATGKAAISNLSDFRKAADEALTQGRQSFQDNYIKPFANQSVSLDPIADRIESLITADMQRSNPALAKNLLKKAAEYRGETANIPEVHQSLVDTNKALDALAKQSPGQQRITTALPSKGWQVAKADALRDVLYGNLPPQAMIENRTLGAIGNVRDAALKAEQTAAITPVAQRSLKQAASIAWSGIKGDATAAALKVLQTSPDAHPDARFAKAWKNLQISVPEGEPTPANRMLPAPADTSGPRPAILGYDYQQGQLPEATPQSQAEALMNFIKNGANATRGKPKLLPPMSAEPGPRSVTEYPGGGASFAGNTATPWQERISPADRRARIVLEFLKNLEQQRKR